MNKYEEALENVRAEWGTSDRDIDILEELVEKARPKFINKCNCIFDEEILYEAIDLECKNRNCYRHDEYQIYLCSGYPAVSIGHDKIRIHVLIGKLLYGKIRKGYVIHHKDFNKLNAMPDNLEYISSSAHTKIHTTKVDHRSEEGKWRGINAAREKTYKKQITKEEIEKMINDGKTKKEIANHFNCGINTIYRRLGYKI